jgi:hypothetical protein
MVYAVKKELHASLVWAILLWNLPGMKFKWYDLLRKRSPLLATKGRIALSKKCTGGSVQVLSTILENKE